MQVPEHMVAQLLSCSLVEELAEIPGLDLASLVTSIAEPLAQILMDKPEILDCIPTDILPMLTSIPAIITHIPASVVVRIIGKIPDTELELLLTDSSIITQLPPSSLMEIIPQVCNV